MTTSPSIDLLAAALADFQMSNKPLRKKAVAHKNDDFFTYAPIDDILRHVRKPLADQKLYVLQMVTGDIGVTTRLMWAQLAQTQHGFIPMADIHVIASPAAAAQWIEDTALVTVKGSIEDKGAAITQLRRYSLITLLGLPTVEPKAAARPNAEDIIAMNRADWMTRSVASEVKHGC